MTFPNALAGVKRIYISVILSIIAVILGAAAGALDAIGGERLRALAAVVVIVAAVLLIVAFFVNIFGVSRASRDESAFKTAFIALIFGVCATILETVLGSEQILGSFCNSVSRICEFLAIFFVCNGLINLADQLGDTAVSTKGKRARAMLLGIWLASAIFKLLSAVFRSMDRMATAFAVVASIGAVVYVIVYLIYIDLLGKAKKMLAQNQEASESAVN